MISKHTPNPLKPILRPSANSTHLEKQVQTDKNGSGVKCLMGKYELLIKPVKEPQKPSYYDLNFNNTTHPALATPSTITRSQHADLTSTTTFTSTTNETFKPEAVISQPKAPLYLDTFTDQFCKDTKLLAHRALDDLIKRVSLESAEFKVEQDTPNRLQLLQETREKIDAAEHQPKIKHHIIKILEKFQMKLIGSNNSQWTIKEHFKEIFSTQLNQQDWFVPKEHYDYKDQHFSLKRIPGSKISSLIKKYTDAGLKGICSGSMDSLKNTFTPNLWITKLTNHQDKTIFKGIRHGVILSETASKDILKAAFETRKSEIDFDHHYQNYLSPEKPYPLKIASIALLTPSKLFGKATLERKLIEKQWQALETLTNSKQPFRLSHTLANRQEVFIYVKPEILTFNLGTNAVASNTFFNRLSQWIEKFDFLNRFDISGWKKSHQVNSENLQKLLNWALDLNATHTDTDKKLRIEVLISRVLELQSNKPQKRPHAYALQKYITLLAYEVGVVPAFNCKSGKDRTAVLETEILAEAMDTAPPTHKQDHISGLSETLHFDSINHRIYDLGNNHIFDLNNNQAYDLNNNQFFDFNKNSITDLNTHQTFDLNTHQTSDSDRIENINELKFNLLTQGNARIQSLNTGLPGNVVFRNTSHFTKVSSVLTPFESHQQQKIRGASDWINS